MEKQEFSEKVYYDKKGNGNQSGKPKFYYQSKQNRDNDKPTHFINLPILETQFIDKYSIFKKDVVSNYYENDEYYAQLPQKEGKLHFTVCVLTLESDEEVERTEATLVKLFKDDTFKSQLKDLSLILNPSTFKSMQNKLDRCRVIYLDVVEDEGKRSIQKIIHRIIDSLVQAQILYDEALEKSHITFNKSKGIYESVLHLTLFNVLFMNKYEKKTGSYISKNIPEAQPLLDYLNKDKTGLFNAKISLGELHFSIMREDKITEKYILVESFPLS